MPTELQLCLRIVLALFLGFCIGVERNMRYKEAGIRTHSIVCAGSSLLMIISQYGFEGTFDHSRVAAQIVSGIGFLGAGIIMYKRETLHGLTTAAGIWTTAGIGMAVGGGLYLIAVVATVLIIALQCILHLNIRFFKTKRYNEIKVEFLQGDGNSNKIKEIFGIKSFTRFNVRNTESDQFCTGIIVSDKDYTEDFLVNTMKEHSFIITINRVDDNSH